MKRSILAAICITAFIFGCSFDLSGLVSLVVLLVSSWLLIAGVVLYGAWYLLGRLMGPGRGPKRFLIIAPLVPGIVAVSSLAGTLLTTQPAMLDEPGLSADRQLEYMYEQDQSDRYSGRFIMMPWRDQDRLMKTRKLVKDETGQLESFSRQTASSKYHAAMILQHGDSPEDYKAAYYLALAADEDGMSEARSLWRAAYDRWQVSIGQPQKYGTQFKLRIGPTGVQNESAEPNSD
ncbi:MAG: hypothetical protein JNL58_30395 [Planctomyces sp.]|nr:hypothetical protein [Planctomyces sp.]